MTTFFCEPEIELEVKGSICPAEPDVGISEAYIDEIDYERILINDVVFKATDTIGDIIDKLYSSAMTEAIFEDAAE